MTLESWRPPAERLRRYRRHARDAYAKARSSTVPADRDSYTAMAERWQQRADWLEAEMRAENATAARRRPSKADPNPPRHRPEI